MSTEVSLCVLSRQSHSCDQKYLAIWQIQTHVCTLLKAVSDSSCCTQALQQQEATAAELASEQQHLQHLSERLDAEQQEQSATRDAACAAQAAFEQVLHQVNGGTTQVLHIRSVL